jgi:hypothetical protein
MPREDEVHARRIGHHGMRIATSVATAFAVERVNQ